MGTSDVLAHTRAALGEPELLTPWPDVDTARELRALAEDLAADPDAAPAVAAWLRQQGGPPPQIGQGGETRYNPDLG
jgi:hypothetical protein